MGQLAGAVGAGNLRARRGQRAYDAGAMAEAQIEARYRRAGCDILARRWRGKSGEIDLIVREGVSIVFVEVKASTTHDCAAGRLTQRQADRICHAATEFCCGLETGMNTEMRFDAALVDRLGRVEIMQNAFGWQ